MDKRSPETVHLLADHPQLVEAIARMRWAEWGNHQGREDLSWWLDITAHEAGRQGLPVTWVAVDQTGDAAGAVALGEFDIDERRDRSPWVLGMIIRPTSRSLGLGRLLLARLEEYAAEQGHPTVWVATGDPAVGFYQRCGYESTERIAAESGDTTVLKRSLSLDLHLKGDLAL